MNGCETIQKAIGFCEENLNGEITVDELAEKSGFSICHFCRMFQHAVGYGPMEYLRKRRLANAVVAIAAGHEYIKDIGVFLGIQLPRKLCQGVSGAVRRDAVPIPADAEQR